MIVAAAPTAVIIFGQNVSLVEGELPRTPPARPVSNWIVTFRDRQILDDCADNVVTPVRRRVGQGVDWGRGL